MLLAASTNKFASSFDLFIITESQSSQLITIAVFIVAKVGGGWSHSWAKTTWNSASLWNSWMPTGGRSNIWTVLVLVFTFRFWFGLVLLRTRHAFISNICSGKSNFSECSCIVIIFISCWDSWVRVATKILHRFWEGSVLL